GRVRRGTAVVGEDRMLAVLPLAGVTAVAAAEVAGIVEPPVPAAGRLEQVAADRAHVAELRRGGGGAGLAQRGRDTRLDLELGERRTRPDRRRTDPTREQRPYVQQRIRLDESVAEQLHEVGAARERRAPVELGEARR